MLNIFLTNLGKYNEGELIGEWVQLPVSEEELEKVLERIGINEQYEEMFITDYESDFGYCVGEYDNIDELNEVAEQFDNLDETEKEVFQAMIEEGYKSEEALEKVSNRDYMLYCDCEDMEDVAREYTYQTGLLDSIPEDLRMYFDFEAFGRDMSFSGHFVFINNDCIEIL